LSTFSFRREHSKGIDGREPRNGAIAAGPARSALDADAHLF